MKRAVFGALLLIILMFLGLSWGIAQQATGPSMAIDEKSFDAREVKEGEVIEHTFTVRNMGGEALEIRKVSPA